jgi:hypothetical protein
MARYYKNGTGVKKDLEKACSLYDAAILKYQTFPQESLVRLIFADQASSDLDDIFWELPSCLGISEDEFWPW